MDQFHRAEYARDRDTDWGSIYNEVEEEIRSSKIRIETSADVQHLSAEQGRLLEDIVVSAHYMIDVYQRSFLRILENYRTHGGPVSEKIIDYLHHEQLTMPSFNIMDKQSAEQWLAKTDISHDMDNSCFLVVFNLPKPLDQFWWKEHQPSQYIGPEKPLLADRSVIEWGKMYCALTGVIWGAIEDMSWEHNLEFSRVNPPGQHTVGVYYYVWDVRR